MRLALDNIGRSKTERKSCFPCCLWRHCCPLVTETNMAGYGDGRLSSSKDALFATAIRFIDEYFSLFAALPGKNFSYLSSTSSIIIHLQSLFCAISSSAVSSLNNICHKCTSVLNKKIGTVAPDDSSNSPVDSLRENVVVSKGEHF